LLKVKLVMQGVVHVEKLVGLTTLLVNSLMVRVPLPELPLAATDKVIFVVLTKVAIVSPVGMFVPLTVAPTMALVKGPEESVTVVVPFVTTPLAKVTGLVVN
jgi:hypothetical protein